MSDTAEEANHDVLDEAAQYLAKAPGAGGGGVGDLSRFLRSYYRHVPAEDLTAYGPARIAAVAAQHAALGEMARQLIARLADSLGR